LREYSKINSVFFMGIKIYQIDTFTNEVFSGNPAAVCPLSNWLNDATLQKIAMENNISTAFYIKNDDHYQIRWFTPTVEATLCGHATFAAAYVLFNFENHKEENILFSSPRSGVLTASKSQNLVSLNFQSDILNEVELTEMFIKCFNIKPKSVFKGKRDYLFLFNSAQDILSIKPEIQTISTLEGRGIIVTSKAKAKEIDFVSRYFPAKLNELEDPVCASAHTSLIPFWAKKLGKTDLSTIQLSERKGYLKCKYLNDRVEIGGEGRLYMMGKIDI